ncbi:MAG: DNA polymerase ligase N-terminal domain-containing protein [Crocosphaera sp.]|nr:DNA polymerase ligase N-terminal domain-containing protein [Crocosphaera sp.]
MLKPFVFHFHTDYKSPHYDLMLDDGDALATWQLEIPLSEIVEKQTISVHKIQDHRLFYLTYEGDISGGRGKIQRIDFGYYQPLMIQVFYWDFILRGQQSTNHYQLRKINPDDNTWSLTKLQTQDDKDGIF